jgi:hypothetical protein
VEKVLEDEALELTERLNGRHAEEAAQRFRTVEPFTAQALYLLIAYGAPVIYTSSYQGLLTRLMLSGSRLWHGFCSLESCQSYPLV